MLDSIDGAGSTAWTRHSTMFWSLQAVAWTLFGIVYFLAMLPRVTFAPMFLLAGKVLWALTGAGVSTGLAVLYRRVSRDDRGLAWTIGIALIASLILGPAWIFGLGTLLEITTGSNVLYDAASFPFVAINHFFVLLAWSGAYLTFTFWDRARLQEQRALHASRLTREAQLEMLSYQLNPHFLFNTLTSVRALVDVDPARARHMISQLSAFLRYTLDRPHNTLETLEREFDVIKQYVSIETTRFEDRLAVELALDSRARSFAVPSFILHPLVENAIRHGEADDTGRLQIMVQAERRRDTVRLVVSNTGYLDRPIDLPPSTENGDRTSVGLRNVWDRLQACYSGRHEFRVFQDGPWVRAVIDLPEREGS